MGIVKNMWMRYVLAALAVLVFACPVYAGDSVSLPIGGTMVTHNGEKQRILRFTNLRIDLEYTFEHDGMIRSVPIRMIQVLENRGGQYLAIKIKGRKKQKMVPGKVAYANPGAVMAELVGRGVNVLKYEYYDKILGTVTTGEIPCADVRRIIFE